MASKRVLFCVLNWGLGHATRCIPIIKELRRMGAEVIIASDGVSARLLKNEFPYLQHLPLPSIEVRYPSGFWLFPYLILKAISLFPKMIAEQWKVKHYIRKYMITHLVSDNRPFSYNAQVRSAYITHQVRMRPAFIGLAHRFFFWRFHEKWVPAPKANDELAGNLGKKAWPISKVKYLGYLNAFKIKNIKRKRYEYLAVLSGPEPQRTLLEQELLPKLEATGKPCVLIRGLAKKKKPPVMKTKFTKVFSYANGEKIAKLIGESKIFIARPGYSTLMNLAGNEVKGLFIPTPGQTEQIYLAKNIEKFKLSICVKQGAIQLEEQSKRAALSLGFTHVPSEFDSFKSILQEFLDK